MSFRRMSFSAIVIRQPSLTVRGPYQISQATLWTPEVTRKDHLTLQLVREVASPSVTQRCRSCLPRPTASADPTPHDPGRRRS